MTRIERGALRGVLGAVSADKYETVNDAAEAIRDGVHDAYDLHGPNGGDEKESLRRDVEAMLQGVLAHYVAGQLSDDQAAFLRECGVILDM